MTKREIIGTPHYLHRVVGQLVHCVLRLTVGDLDVVNLLLGPGNVNLAVSS